MNHKLESRLLQETPTTSVRYADDTTLMAESEEEIGYVLQERLAPFHCPKLLHDQLNIFRPILQNSTSMPLLMLFNLPEIPPFNFYL